MIGGTSQPAPGHQDPQILQRLADLEEVIRQYQDAPVPMNYVHILPLEFQQHGFSDERKKYPTNIAQIAASIGTTQVFGRPFDHFTEDQVRKALHLGDRESVPPGSPPRSTLQVPLPHYRRFWTQPEPEPELPTISSTPLPIPAGPLPSLDPLSSSVKKEPGRSPPRPRRSTPAYQPGPLLKKLKDNRGASAADPARSGVSPLLTSSMRPSPSSNYPHSMHTSLPLHTLPYVSDRPEGATMPGLYSAPPPNLIPGMGNTSAASMAVMPGMDTYMPGLYAPMPASLPFVLPQAEEVDVDKIRQRRVSELTTDELLTIITDITKKLRNRKTRTWKGKNPLVVDITPANCAQLGIPRYFSVIQQPMNLTIIAKKVRSGSYRDLHEYVGDVELMVNNAQRFNQEGTPVYNFATEMHDVFQKLIEKTLEEYSIEQDPSRPLLGK